MFTLADEDRSILRNASGNRNLQPTITNVLTAGKHVVRLPEHRENYLRATAQLKTDKDSQNPEADSSKYSRELALVRYVWRKALIKRFQRQDQTRTGMYFQGGPDTHSEAPTSVQNLTDGGLNTIVQVGQLSLLYGKPPYSLFSSPISNSWLSLFPRVSVWYLSCRDIPLYAEVQQRHENNIVQCVLFSVSTWIVINWWMSFSYRKGRLSICVH